MSGSNGPTAQQIAGTQDFINQHTQKSDPLQAILGTGGMSATTPQSMSMANPTQGPAAVPKPPNPIAQIAQQGIGQAATAGLGAGDAAAAAARASGAMLPGAGSADALSGMMQGMGDAQRAAIQKKIQLAMMLAGGG